MHCTSKLHIVTLRAHLPVAQRPRALVFRAIPDKTLDFAGCAIWDVKGFHGGSFCSCNTLRQSDGTKVWNGLLYFFFEIIFRRAHHSVNYVETTQPNRGVLMNDCRTDHQGNVGYDTIFSTEIRTPETRALDARLADLPRESLRPS